MTRTSHSSISTYQSAILTEMGISNWGLLSQEKVEASPSEAQMKELKQPESVAYNTSSVKESALTKLQQLKKQNAPLKKTDSILTTFTKDDLSTPIFQDVLLALELADTSVIHVDNGQEQRYEEYPIFWGVGDSLSYKNKKLYTTSLKGLSTSATLKKQLWDLLKEAKVNSL
ncbi:DNA polymerase III subunit psi [Paraglaciecola sp. 2405UD69-4]|uniref:DNA polymerase III subunit psi n=1 Tax=Paraglaciecola sp. 2405UD69-4 TaxID=3391836 RepID=UPI0039C8F1CA